MRIPPLIWHCEYFFGQETKCVLDTAASGRTVAPGPDGTMEFASADTVAYEYESRTSIVNVGTVSDGIRRPIVVYREGPAATVQVSVAISGTAYGTPCQVSWGLLVDSPDAVTTMTYQDWPSTQPLGTRYFPATGTYAFSVGPGPLLFSFFAGVPYFPAPPPGGTSTGFVQCTLTSIRFQPG
jgi:hypothetical protein